MWWNGWMNDGRERGGASWAGWGLGGVVLVYFGFPALWVWPFVKIYGVGPYPAWTEYMGLPIQWLGNHVPAYREWVVWGMKLLGL